MSPSQFTGEIRTLSQIEDAHVIRLRFNFLGVKVASPGHDIKHTSRPRHSMLQVLEVVSVFSAASKSQLLFFSIHFCSLFS